MYLYSKGLKLKFPTRNVTCPEESGYTFDRCTRSLHYVTGPWSDTQLEVHQERGTLSLYLLELNRFTLKSDQMTVTNDEQQVVSKQRVADHGEVYTAKREVNAMLDLVKEETERIDSRFLEPACGTGNFLVEILNRKMEAVHRMHAKNRFEYDLSSAQAVSSMYGVELLPDNVEACRERLFLLYHRRCLCLPHQD